jgi:hypothetical protein
MINSLVYKKSRKPFKSGLTLNRIKGICINPHTGNKAFYFWEDDSVVDIKQCLVLSKYENLEETLPVVIGSN